MAMARRGESGAPGIRPEGVTAGGGSTHSDAATVASPTRTAPMESDWSDAAWLAWLAAEHGPDMTVVADPDGVVRFVSTAAERMLGFDRRRHPTACIVDFVHADDVPTIIAAIDGVSNRPCYHRPLAVRVRTAVGAFVDTEVTTRTLPGPGGVWSILVIRVRGDRTELADRREALHRLIQSAAVECAHARWFDVDGVVEHLLRSLCGVFGARQVEVAWCDGERRGEEALRVGAMWSARAEDDWSAGPPSPVGAPFDSMCLDRLCQDPLATACARDDLAAIHGCPTAAAFVACGLGSVVEIRLSSGYPSAVLRLAFAGGLDQWDEINAEPTALVGLLVLSTMRRCGAEADLRERARRDSLTGLLNREELYRSAEEAIRSAGVSGAVGVLYCDLDRFKATNDRHGHAAGDEILRTVAQVLLSSVREGDAVARMGGDEFAALCRGLESPEHLEAIADRLRSAVATTEVSSGEVRLDGVRMSVGVAVWRDPQTVDDLLGAADAAMYTAKRQRRDADEGRGSGEMGDGVVEDPEQRRT